MGERATVHLPESLPLCVILAFQRAGDRAGLGSVVVSHLIGGVAGLLAYSLLAGGVSFVVFHALVLSAYHRATDPSRPGLVDG